MKTLKHLVTGEVIGTYTEDCTCENAYCKHLISDFDKYMNKLTYQDAMDLEEANFPYKENRLYPTVQPRGQMYPAPRVPSLEELIEACGEDFLYLTHAFPGTEEAWSSDSYVEDIETVYGTNPLQAVKNLYCALNKK